MPRPKYTDRAMLARVAKRAMEARLARDWTREQLAEAIGVEPGTIWRYETGRLPISLSMLVRVSRALGVPAEELIKAPKPSAHEEQLLHAYRRLTDVQRRAVLTMVMGMKPSR